MHATVRAFALILTVLFGHLFVASSVLARADADTYCSLPQAFGAALRYLRVDLGYEVTERDPEAAYLLFKYRVPGDPKRDVAGAIELVKVDKRVRIFVKIPQMPQLHEQLLRDGLLKKLSQEYGEPTRPGLEKPKGVAPDAGSDSTSNYSD
jgi:hypothetical protein